MYDVYVLQLEGRRGKQYGCAFDMFSFSIFVIRLGGAGIRNANATARLWSFGSDKYDVNDPIYNEDVD